MGETLEKEIVRDQTQVFTVKLDKDQYARIVFNWQGLDLKVAVTDPLGQPVPASSLFIRQSVPALSILAASGGEYKLTITPDTKQRFVARYSIRLDQLHPAEETDRLRLQAQDLLAQAQKAAPRVAQGQLDQARVLLQQLQDTEAQAQTLQLLGDAYRDTAEPDKARTSYEAAALIFKANGNARGEAYVKMSLGVALRNLASAKDALEQFQFARQLFAGIGDTRGEASALYNQAYSDMVIGLTPSAISDLNACLTLRRALADKPGEVNVLNSLADANRLMGNLDLALELYDQATSAAKDLDSKVFDATLLKNRAVVYDDMGNWQKAREDYLSAISVYELQLGQGGLTVCYSSPAPSAATLCRSAASALDNVGETYNSLGEPTKAIQEFEKSLRIREALNQPAGQGQTRFHLGYGYFLLNDPTRAFEYFNAAIPFLQKSGDDKTLALTYTYMGMVHNALNHYPEALALYQRALPVVEKSGDKRSQAITLDKIGSVLAVLKDSAGSDQAFARALSLWRTVQDPDGQALTLYNMANAKRAEGDLRAASENVSDALKLIETLRTEVTNQRLRSSYLANKANYYELDIDLKMQLSERENNAEYKASALEANEKGRARVLLDTLKEAGVGRGVAAENSDPRFSSLLGERLNLLSAMAMKGQVKTTVLSGPHTEEQIATLNRDLAALYDRYEELDSRVRERNPRFANLTRPQPASLAEIQAQLDDETSLVEFALGERRSYVWIVNRNSLEAVPLPPRHEIESYANRVVAALSAQGRDEKGEDAATKQARVEKAESDYAPAAASLSNAVLGPIASRLNRKRLLIVADGALQLLPFAALPLPGASVSELNPPTMIQNYELVNLPSASVLVLQRKELANRTSPAHALAVIADPVFGPTDERLTSAKKDRSALARNGSKPGPPASASRGLSASVIEPTRLSRSLSDLGFRSAGEVPRLPYANREANAILKLVPRGESFRALGFQANRQTLMNPKLAQYRVIHLATHGIMDPNNPELSGVLLSMLDEKGREQNGYIGLSEIYNLNLPADLVVLSACETGTGKEIRGEGLIALTRGFMYAGAASLVASLWKVDDRATAELMTIFYQELLVNKLKPAAALREAQRKISLNPKWNQPHYWAGFVLQGEWR
ncbi:MAG TPA: CHAT domain-containing protein [Pyrinomonadaceae bacterium]